MRNQKTNDMTTKTTTSRDWRRLVRSVIMMTVLLCAALPANGQAVIMNGNYYLTHNEAGTSVNSAATNTFNPATCLWAYASRDYIRTANSSGAAINNNNNYLQYTSLSLGTDWGNWYRGGDEEYIYHRTGGTYSRRYHYPTLSNTTWGWAYNQTSQNYSTTLYDVTITSQAATATNPTINGADVLTATGNTTYTASGASYRAAYTNYYFRSANHYVDANGNTITPANATIGTYSWSLTDNAYATVNSTSGVVTVTSLPEYDINLTLTVTATATGGTPAAPANTTLTGTKQITIQGTKPSAPTITVSGTNVTLATDAAGSTTIRYTLDGTDPTASTGTVYSGAIDLSGSTTSPVTIKAITVRSGNTSDVTEQSVTLTLPEPTITINGEAKTATIASSIAGATIYYTTDGTTPTTSSSQYTGTISGLSYMTTVKAIAVKDGWNNSPVASGIVTIPSGVGGGVVTLFDYEPHSWSYYSDASTPVQLHSLNPADVKITYYGDGIMMTGSADYNASSTDYITSTHADYKVGAKVNVGGEDENTFVYYKTLERENADGSGRCPYTPIPNPFQVRPRYGDRGTTDANIFTGWRGFQCWRLKSVTGGSVYSVASGGTALTTGAVINAETPIYLAPTAEYGMEVELEAVWAIAYVKKANQANENPVGTNNVGYERNFCVPTTGAGYTLYAGTGKRITNANHIPVTISCYYPDGTAPDNTNNSISNTAFALTADTKFENIPINLTSNTVTLDNYDIIVGRGCGTSTINNLQGINAGATDLDYTIRIESGTYNQFCFVREGTNTTVSGRYLIKAIMGSDYDRATGTNNKLIVSPNSSLFLARTVGFTGSSNKDQKTFDCVFKSGTYQSGYWNGTDQSGQNAYLNIAYLGQNSAQGNTYPGVRCVTVEGGEFGGMCGGRGVSSNSNNSTYVTPEVIAFDLRIKGGTFHGSVFGGAADNPSIGSRRFIITGGEIQSWIAGGCNGTGSQSGTGATDGDSYIYVGGTALVGGNTTITINDTPGGQIFGAGRGVSGRLSSVNHSHVVVADKATVSNTSGDGGFVYGGSYNGNIADVSNVYITGGTVEGKVFGGSYGNGNSGAIPVANIIMTGGHVTKGVYGGSNSNGNVGDVTMHIDGGTVGNSTSEDGVYGGGYGANTSVTGDVSVTLGASTSAPDSATVNGNVYGGSALGDVNANTSNTTTVTMNKALINGYLFGGAYGNGADVHGHITLNINGGRVVNDAFGGGDAAAYSPNGNYPVINMTGGKVTNLFGGGKGATAIVTGNPQVTLSGNAKVTGNVYGGGDAAQVSGHTNVQLHD